MLTLNKKVIGRLIFFDFADFSPPLRLTPTNKVFRSFLGGFGNKCVARVSCPMYEKQSGVIDERGEDECKFGVNDGA
jgi:hypothetical protein